MTQTTPHMQWNHLRNACVYLKTVSDGKRRNQSIVTLRITISRISQTKSKLHILILNIQDVFIY